ncbi:MAG: hypothetical protein IIA02_06065 [Proteobacteria bacterium]|uniref:hypothetical protein n=1 Tax=Aquabacterium sp. TaxID=1872578 RepID=UPI0035C744AC|nr:hypothetical protein [Pseudomonadota bacterium]
MHIKHRWMRALVGLAALPWTLPCLAQDGPQNTPHNAPHSGLQTLPDHELLALHGAGLDDIALSRLNAGPNAGQGAGQDRRRKGDERRAGPPPDAQDSHKDDAKRPETASSGASQSQLLMNTLSRQAVQMETSLALSAALQGSANAVRMAQTGAMLAAITPVTMVTAPLAMPLFGAPMLPR